MIINYRINIYKSFLNISYLLVGLHPALVRNEFKCKDYSVNEHIFLRFNLELPLILVFMIVYEIKI